MITYTGTDEFYADDRDRITVIADGDFVVYAFIDDEAQAVLGPYNSGDRRFFHDNAGAHFFPRFKVKCGKNVNWTLSIDEYAKSCEKVDSKRIESFVDEPPQSMREYVQQYVAQEFSAQMRQQGEESLEDFDDFDVDEEPVEASPYEYVEMPEDPIEPLKPEPESLPGTPSEGSEDPVKRPEDSDKTVDSEPPKEAKK